MIEGLAEEAGAFIFWISTSSFYKSLAINYGYEESCGPYIVSFESQGILEEIPYADTQVVAAWMLM
jgi:hypothetical protein